VEGLGPQQCPKIRPEGEARRQDDGEGREQGGETALSVRELGV
jgi:hypothetical protein